MQIVVGVICVWKYIFNKVLFMRSIYTIVFVAILVVGAMAARIEHNQTVVRSGERGKTEERGGKTNGQIATQVVPSHNKPYLSQEGGEQGKKRHQQSIETFQQQQQSNRPQQAKLWQLDSPATQHKETEKGSSMAQEKSQDISQKQGKLNQKKQPMEESKNVEIEKKVQPFDEAKQNSESVNPNEVIKSFDEQEGKKGKTKGILSETVLIKVVSSNSTFNRTAQNTKKKSVVQQENEKQEINIIPAEKKINKTIEDHTTTNATSNASKMESEQKKTNTTEEKTISEPKKIKEDRPIIVFKPPQPVITSDDGRVHLPEKKDIPKVEQQDNQTKQIQHKKKHSSNQTLSREKEESIKRQIEKNIKVIPIQQSQPVKKKTPKENNQKQEVVYKQESSKMNIKSLDKGLRSQEEQKEGQMKKSQEKEEKNEPKETKKQLASEVSQKELEIEKNLTKSQRLDKLIEEIKSPSSKLPQKSKQQIIEYLQESKQSQKQRQKQEKDSESQQFLSHEAFEMKQLTKEQAQQDRDKQFIESKQMSSSTIIVIIILTFLISIPICKEIRSKNHPRNHVDSSQSIAQGNTREQDERFETSEEFAERLDEQDN